MLTQLCSTFCRRRLVVGFWLFLAATLASTGAGLWNIRKDRVVQQAAMDSSRSLLVSKIHDSLMRARDLVDRFAEEASREIAKVGPDSLSRRLREMMRERPCVFGAGMGLDPDWIRSRGRGGSGLGANKFGQWSAYLLRSDSANGSARQVDYDYTDTSLESGWWYTRTAKVLGPQWVGPYYSPTAQTNLVAYSRPIFDEKRRFTGVVRAVYSLAELRARVAVTSATQDGYSVLVGKDGAILYHPRVELMKGNSTIRALAEKTGNATLLAFADSMDRGVTSGKMPYNSIFTGEKAHLEYDRIRGVDWYLLSVVSDAGSNPFCAYQRHVFLLVLAVTILLCWGWCLAWSRRLWVGAIGVSVFFSMGIVAMCWLSVEKFESGICTPLSVLVKGGSSDQGEEMDCSRAPLANAFAASAFMNRCFELNESIRSIPTGILIQTVNFTSAYSFSVSGYVWQKYRSLEDTALLGVEFPENEEVDIEQAYDEQVGPGEYVRGWSFSADIRQPFGYRLYPLDKEEIWIRMQPKGLNQQVMLEPDFMSYRKTRGALFGVDQSLVLPQWKILGTNFSYAKNTSSSSYGRGEFRNQGEQPELYFSIHVRRNIFDAFISQFIPLLVIILMLFSILWVGRKKDDPGLLGFNALSGASGCSAVFFIVIYNHISIRNQLGAPGVVYMEFYFFVTYLAILYVSLNSILVAMDHKTRFINHEDNLISRLIYWPMVTGILFVSTFVAFY